MRDAEIVVHRKFLLTPLREGRLRPFSAFWRIPHFYSRPCGRGDVPGRHCRC